MIESDFGARAQAYSRVHVFSAGKAASAGVAESCGDKTISHPSRPGGHCCQAVVTHDIPPLTPERTTSAKRRCSRRRQGGEEFNVLGVPMLGGAVRYRRLWERSHSRNIQMF